MSDNDVKIKVSLDGADTAEKGLRGVGDGASDSDSKLGKLASGGLKGVAIGAAALATATVAGAVGLFQIAKGAADAGDKIDEMSQKLGLSNKGYQEWDYILSQNGASVDTLKGAMTRLNAAVDEGINGAGASADKFARLGISLDDLQGKSREEIFDMTIKGLQGVTDQGERAAIATQLLGRSAAELNPLLNAGAANTEELRKKAEELGLVMSDEAVAAADEFHDSLDTLQRTVGGLRNSLGAELLPGINEVMNGLTGLLAGTEGADDRIKAGAETLVGSISSVLPKILTIFSQLLGGVAIVAPGIVGALVQGITDNLPTLIGTVSGAIVNLVNIIATQAPAFVTSGVQAIAALAIGIGNALPTLIPVIVTGLISVVQALIDSAPMLLGAGITLITGLGEGIIEAIPMLVAALPAIIDGIVNFITTALPQLLDGGLTLLLGLTNGIITALPTLIAELPKIIVGIITFLTSAIPQLVTAGVQLLLALVGALPTIIDGIVGALPQIITAIIVALVTMQPELIKAGIDLFLGLIGALPQIIIGIVNAVPQIITGLVQAFTDPATIGQLAQAGMQLIMGLWNGIQGAQGWLMDQISGFVDNVVGGIASFFGIHSPSTRLRDEIGAHLPSGIGLGVKNHSDDAIRPIQDLNTKILDEASRLNTTVAFTHDSNLTQTVVSMQATSQQPGAISVEATLDPYAVSAAISDAFSSSGQDQTEFKLDPESIRLLGAEIAANLRADNRQGASLLG